MKTQFKQVFVCTGCGSLQPKWMGRCPDCQNWNTLVEEVVSKSKESVGIAPRQGTFATGLDRIQTIQEDRLLTRIPEFDRVLGGGFVPGSLILLSGDPGIGKSTLILQIAHGVAVPGEKVVYASGEESVQQIKMRAERLNAVHGNILVTNEVNVCSLIQEAKKLKPQILVVDSIQTILNPDFGSTPGTVTQIRECTNLLMHFAKSESVTVIVIGHVTKDGVLAGPKILEHLVDCAMHLEGDPANGYRILRSQKNRFGSTGEIGVFAMEGYGLIGVANPSALFLSERTEPLEGSAVAVSMEGSRPILVEIQVLVGKTSFSTPRRLATGFDSNRFTILLAVLEKRSGLYLSQFDIYAGVTGGFRLTEPAIDLATAAAVSSSLHARPLPKGTAFFGEVGLNGEVRATSHIGLRLTECVKLGFERIYLPSQSLRVEKENIAKILEGVDHQVTLVPVDMVAQVVQWEND